MANLGSTKGSSHDFKEAPRRFVGSLGDQAFSVAIQPDGKAVVAGSAVVNLNTQFAVARYQ
jgi:hypothetical protein